METLIKNVLDEYARHNFFSDVVRITVARKITEKLTAVGVKNPTGDSSNGDNRVDLLQRSRLADQSRAAIESVERPSSEKENVKKSRAAAISNKKDDIKKSRGSKKLPSGNNLKERLSNSTDKKNRSVKKRANRKTKKATSRSNEV